MARHRNVRSMQYEDDLEYDEYGQSVEDDYCISPATAAQFTFDRTSSQHQLGNFFAGEDIPEEEEDGDSDGHTDSLQGSSSFTRPELAEADDAKLNFCLEELRNILGDTTPESILVKAALEASFDPELAMNRILNQQAEATVITENSKVQFSMGSDAPAPKPQRAPQERRNRARGRKTPNVVENSTQEQPVKPEPVTATTECDPILVPSSARMTFSSGKPKAGFDMAQSNNNVILKDKSDISPGKRLPETSQITLADSEKDIAASLMGIQLEPSTPKKEESASITPSTSAASTPLHKVASKVKLVDRDQLAREYSRRRESAGKDNLNLVVIGHVDAGKSTLMGHVLYQLGFVNKRLMHKYEQESKKLGKASFAYAWVLDETEEERTRGVTMDIAQTKFETPSKIVNLLDAPGHKDFIPNMITGAAQADAAVLVVNATRGEFETGFDAGGQTREHAMLIRSLGVSQLIVCINKMDTVDWAKDRYEEISKKLGQFLKQAGFREADLSYIPGSGLSGENLTKSPTVPELASWYTGPTLIQQIDKFKPPERAIDKPCRLCVTDVFKGMGQGFSVAGTIQAGMIQAGERLLVMPQGEYCAIRGIQIDETSSPYAFAGDNVILTITGIEINNIGIGSILCDYTNPIRAVSRFKARVVIFNTDLPITRGFPVVLHFQSLNVPAHIRKLVCQLNKTTGEIIRKKPRCLSKNSSAVIEIELARSICLELYKDYKDLGRFMLRHAGATIAAGMVTEIGPAKASKAE